MKSLLILLTLLSLSLAVSLKKLQDGPSFCNGLDCPKYTLVGKKDGYEVRDYEASRWVGTTIASSEWKKAADTGFDRLFKYISGENSANTKIPMATPVATKIDPGQGGVNNFTILFFTPFAFKTNTPVPTNPELAIVDLPAITAYVLSFGGFENDEDLKKRSYQLATDLRRDNVDFTTAPSFTAGYDSPYRLLDRHNEVWYLAK